jgi:glycosyltransferase involved in cell wall biosynthesis
VNPCTTMAQTIVLDGYMLGKRLSETGISRYLVNLLREFERITAREQDPEFLVLVPSLSECRSNGFRHRPGFAMAAEPLMRFHRAWKYGLVNSLTIRMRSGVLFIPIPVSVYVKPGRLAVTVHDIVPLVFPEQYASPMGRVFVHTYRSSVSKADLILTDSAYSKADMISRLGVPAAKIVVAPLGFDSDMFHRGPAGSAEGRELLGRYAIDRPYILHVGRGDPRKNLVRLVQSYRMLTARRRDLDFQLVLSGPLGWGYQPLLQLLKEPSLRNRVILTGPVPDCELTVLYGQATAFAMPSLYEGFGLPVLEAMACGTPVMSSNRSSLPEIAGEAALYFDPESVEEMSEAMERVLTDSAWREELVGKGLQRAQQFSWEACARTTLAALKNL